MKIRQANVWSFFSWQISTIRQAMSYEKMNRIRSHDKLKIHKVQKYSFMNTFAHTLCHPES